MSSTREETSDRIRWLLETEGATIQKNLKRNNKNRYAAFEELGSDRHEDLRSRARALKEQAIEDLPNLIEELTESVESNGGKVYIASDADDANQYAASVCTEKDAKSVVKSKSMTSEEIDVNEYLEEHDIDVYETDLGELVLQVADEDPSHLIGPGLHKSREEIAELFNDTFDPEDSLETAQELTQFARDYLADRIDEADVGMTGANFVVADSGSILLITNEGNARKTIEATDTHIAVAGVEKILPTITDLEPFIELVARSGNGQHITSYTSLYTPPINTPANDPTAERDFHLVLIDNGRMAMRDDDVLRETLYCVRCSACLNSCANFQHVGGHGFGGETYTGGIATGWEAGVHGFDSAAEFNDLCTGCSRCVNQCPVKIDIPWINTAVRDRINSDKEIPLESIYEGLMPDAETNGPDLQKRFFGNFETLAKAGSATAPISNWAATTPPVQWAMDRWVGVDSRRELPKFERQTLTDWFESRPDRSPADPVRSATVYPDIYTNYIETDRGKAAVRTLEVLGVDVELASVNESGRAPLSQGMIETATEKAKAIAHDFVPRIDSGRDIVVIEPSDLAMFRSDYEHLLPEDTHERIEDHSYDVMEYVYGVLANNDNAGSLRSGDERHVVYHSHCQQRTLGLEAYTVAVLEQCGFQVTETDVECCGMAGSFGYKSQYYDLSMNVGEAVDEQIQAADTDHVVTSGTSCTEQIRSLTGDQPTHVIELIDPTA